MAFGDFYRKKLRRFLETVDDEAFIQLLWATDALQANGELVAAPHLDHNYPSAAATTDIGDKHFIYKWELETLANEALVTPKRVRRRNGLVRSLNTRYFKSVAQMTNVLRKLENAEDARRVNDQSVLREMARIANRQFEWQRGYFNTPQFYRNAFVYGQGHCADYFKTQHGITVSQFTLVGLSIYLLLTKHPSVLCNADFSAVGVAAQDLECALALLAKPVADMRALATRERSTGSVTAYKASVLRRFPCVIFGDRNSRVRAPLPQLILERVTAGVFYDVVGGGGALRNDYGHRFEEYCLTYLRAMLPELDWRKETKYRVKGNDVHTPDILLAEGAGLDLAVECKATRMGYGAKFGEGDLDERGFDEIIKAVFQLWRFFSHCRRGLAGTTFNTDSVGAVLTLDNWLQMANPLQDERHMSLDVPKGIAYPRLLLLWQILRDGMGSRWEPDRIVAVVKLYLDDSGTDPQTPSILMGGLVARPRQWRRCEKEAEQLLSALGIETLHAKEFHNCTGPFEGWTHQQKLDLAGQIGACWQRNKVVGCFLAAHKENYGLARGARTDLPAAVSQCMALLVQHLMEDGVVRGFIEKDGLSILVERGNRNSGGMQKIHDEVLVPTYGDLLRSFSFVPKTDSRAIQTADFLAFHVRRHMDAQMKANKGLRFGDVLRKLRQPDPNVKPLRFIGNFLEDLRFSPA